MRSLVLVLAVLAACGSDSKPRTFDGRWTAELLIYECAASGAVPDYMITATFEIAGENLEIFDQAGTTSAGEITVQRDGDTIVMTGDVPLGVPGTLMGVEAMLVRDRNTAAAADGSSVEAYSFDPEMMDCRLSMTLLRQ
jgi:hypothetical protein